MSFCDFVVKYDPTKDSSEDITKRILYSIYVKRMKAHKPVITFIGGDSGEGKSLSTIRLQELLCEIQGLDIRKYFNIINVHTPLEYPTKLDSLLYDKEYHKANIICVHEARELVKAKNWQSFLTQSIADINALSRAIKRLSIFIISQFIRDITTDIRYTLNYYVVVKRPLRQKARLYFHILWKDDRDLEKPKLRKRKLSGYLVYPNGRYRRYVPRYLEVSKPSQDLIDIFEKDDYNAKTGIIRNKINKLINEIELDIGTENKKITAMVDFYVKDLDNLHTIGKRYKNQFKIKSDISKMHNLTKAEAVRFETLINEKIKEKGLLQQENKEGREELTHEAKND